MSKKKKIFIGIVLLLTLPFAMKSVRRQVCELTYVCFYTCDEYSGKPVLITLNRQLTCEEIELIKQKEFVYRVKKSLWLIEEKIPSKGTVFTNEGVYLDGVLQQDNKNLENGEDNE